MRAGDFLKTRIGHGTPGIFSCAFSYGYDGTKRERELETPKDRPHSAAAAIRMARLAEEELWELDELELGSPDSDASERTGKRAYETSRSSDESELGERQTCTVTAQEDLASVSRTELWTRSSTGCVRSSRGAQKKLAID